MSEFDVEEIYDEIITIMWNKRFLMRPPVVRQLHHKSSGEECAVKGLSIVVVFHELLIVLTEHLSPFKDYKLYKARMVYISSY